jgi:hypothetical protein
MKRIHVLAAALMAAAVLLSATTTHAGTDPVAKCLAGKLKATGKLVATSLKCDSKAAAKGLGLDGGCVAKAEDKFSSAFAKADAGGCASNLEPTRSRGRIIDAKVVKQTLPRGHATLASRCAAKKMKAAGKYALLALKAEGGNLRKPDSAKLAAKLEKAAAKLTKAFPKAEKKADCDRHDDAAVVQDAVDAFVAGELDCLVGAADCDGVSDDVPDGGGTVSTDESGSGATGSDPVETTITTSAGGSIAISEADVTLNPGGAFVLFGREVQIAAPRVSRTAPLHITFAIDGSALPGGVTAADVVVLKDGIELDDCAGAPGVALPDPCVESRTPLLDGDVEVVALSSSASGWNSGIRSSCPASLSWHTRADDGIVVAASDHDMGTTGLAHNMNPVNDATFRIGLDCGGTSTHPCGTCSVTGILASLGNCRCAGDNRTVCDEPLVADFDDCAGATCECFVNPPTPTLSGNVGACHVRRLVSDITGTWDPDLGAGALEMDEAWQVYLGMNLLSQCPRCVGDTAVNDGIADGVCSGGLNDGQSCDSGGTDPLFAPPAGGEYSIDCLPSPGLNVSGLGFHIDLSHTTGSASLAAGLSCALGAASCACGLCSGGNVACASNAECSAARAGVCEADEFQYPNACTGLSCIDVGGGEGRCQSNTDKYCDGIVRPDGGGMIACLSDSDCQPGTIGVDAGNCTIVEARPCFLDPIVANGSPDPVHPITVGIACIPTGSNSGINSGIGLPGPARLVTEREITVP